VQSCGRGRQLTPSPADESALRSGCTTLISRSPTSTETWSSIPLRTVSKRVNYPTLLAHGFCARAMRGATRREFEAVTPPRTARGASLRAVLTGLLACASVRPGTLRSLLTGRRPVRMVRGICDSSRLEAGGSASKSLTNSPRFDGTSRVCRANATPKQVKGCRLPQYETANWTGLQPSGGSSIHFRSVHRVPKR